MKAISPSDRIFIAGHKGLVGSEIVANLKQRGYHNLQVRTKGELDLCDQASTFRFLETEKPDVVFVAGARVGGIFANATYRAEFIHENLAISHNVIWGAHLANVRRLIFLSSSCAYPRECPQPISEASLLTGSLEPTNQPYAVAKIAGMELVNGLRRQYGRDYFTVMPTNLYGPGDNFHPDNSHVIPALIGRFIEAKSRGDSEVLVWGTGKPRREFMFAPDCADAIVHLAEVVGRDFFSGAGYNAAGLSHMNVGTGVDLSIAELAKLIAARTGYKGNVRFDPSKPDGTPVKRLDITLLATTGWKPSTTLESGIDQTIAWLAKTRR